ncbi:MAG TPA: hypothetical protein VE153_20000 [Myxococcus sp.]|nr:hypothetical protein [Myxococcus sp.]
MSKYRTPHFPLSGKRSVTASRLPWRAALLSGVLAAAPGCTVDTEPPPPEAIEVEPEHILQSERRGIGLEPLPEREGPSAMYTNIDPRRSLAVTDQAILSRFTLQRVMNQLAAQSGTGITGLQLYRQWWDTQRPSPGLGVGGRHCNDEVTNGQTSLNSFFYECPRPEGQQALEDPFNSPGGPSDYTAIGLFNRIDLAPRDGTDCGEYRIIFARNSGKTDPLNRNLVIFEGLLPNPNHHLGLEGCRPVANFWRDLTNNPDINSRASALETFFFNGLPGGFMPVVHIENYGTRTHLATGQIRSNQFMRQTDNTVTWQLREFKLRSTCDGYGCGLRFVPVTVKTNPAGTLFNSASSHSRAYEWQNDTFPRWLPDLLVNDINRFKLFVPDRFNSGQSDSQDPVENNYTAQFSPGSAFASNIQNRLTQLNSGLTPTQVVNRALTLSCAGCHEQSDGDDLGGGLVWPNKAALGGQEFRFIHVTERVTEAGPNGPRFAMSPLLTGTFLPHRKAVLENFIDSQQPAACNGTSGQWNGCRGSGCRVCIDLVQQYPCYFVNHPQCVPNDTCEGQYFQCNSLCPAPTQADTCVTTTCGNGYCDNGENQLDCPQDCMGYCGDGYCDPEEYYNCPLDCGGGGGCPDPRQINCHVEPM